MNEIPSDKEIDSSSEEAPVSGNKGVYVTIGVLMILVAAVIVLLVQKNRLEEERTRQDDALNVAYIRLDSISNELNDRIVTISRLGGDIDTLMAIKEQLETEKKQLLDRDERRKLTIRDLQDKVDGYQELLLLKDEEIKQLTRINEQLLEENTGLKVETADLSRSIQEIRKEKEQLNEKIELVSKLKVEDMNITAVSARGRERSMEFKNRHIEQLKITFAVSENRVAPIEGKDLLVRIVAPDGNVLFDITRGSGTFMFDSREMFYSAKKEILYDRTKQEVTIFYDKGSDYDIGQHQVEVYTDQYLMGKGAFVVQG